MVYCATVIEKLYQTFLFASSSPCPPFALQLKMEFKWCYCCNIMGDKLIPNFAAKFQR